MHNVSINNKIRFMVIFRFSFSSPRSDRAREHASIIKCGTGSGDFPAGKSKCKYTKFLGNYIPFYTESSWRMCLLCCRSCRSRRSRVCKLAHPQLRPKASAIELARIAEPPQQKRNLFRKSALAGTSVGTRKVLRLWITVGVNLYIIANFY